MTGYKHQLHSRLQATAATAHHVKTVCLAFGWVASRDAKPRSEHKHIVYLLRGIPYHGRFVNIAHHLLKLCGPLSLFLVVQSDFLREFPRGRHLDALKVITT